MTFAHPAALLLLLLLPLFAWLKGKRGKPPAFVYSSVQLVRAILNVTRTRSGGFLSALRWLTLNQTPATGANDEWFARLCAQAGRKGGA